MGDGLSDGDLISRIRLAKDHYAALLIPRDASEDDIKRAYRRLALRLHPDKNQHPGAEEAFKRIARAHDALSDSERDYDRFGESAGQPAADPFQGFSTFNFPQGARGANGRANPQFFFFNAGSGPTHRQRPPQPAQFDFNFDSRSLIFLLPLLLILFYVFFAFLLILLRHMHLWLPILLAPSHLRSYVAFAVLLWTILS